MKLHLFATAIAGSVALGCGGHSKSSNPLPQEQVDPLAFYRLPSYRAVLSDGDRVYVRLDFDEISGMEGLAEIYDGTGESTDLRVYGVDIEGDEPRNGQISLRMDPGTPTDPLDDAVLRGQVSNGALTGGSFDRDLSDGGDNGESLSFRPVAATRESGEWLFPRIFRKPSYYSITEKNFLGFFSTHKEEFPPVYDSGEFMGTADNAYRLAVVDSPIWKRELWAWKRTHESVGHIDMWWGSLCFTIGLKHVDASGFSPAKWTTQDMGAEGKAWKGSMWTQWMTADRNGDFVFAY